MEDVAFCKAMKRFGPPACRRERCAPPDGAGSRAACCAPSSSCGACASCTSSARARSASRASTPMIIVFAKAPVPGEAKTRLIPRLGAWGAARLHVRLTLHALRTARAANCGPVELHLTRRHSLFKGRGCSAGAISASACSTHSADPGRRSSSAPIARCVLGADLQRAARWLRGGYDAVLAPAEDGGYALIGLRKPIPAIFSEASPGEASACTRDGEETGRLSLARAAERLGPRPAAGPRAPQIAPPPLGVSARRSAMRR